MIMENGAISLVHGGYKFIRDRVDNDRSYWRCRHSFKYNCKSRVVTKRINGYDMLKIRNAEHNHTDIKKPVKGKKKALKLKQIKKKKNNSTIMTRIIRPQLSVSKVVPQSSANIIPPMPKLKPKPLPKQIIVDETNVRSDDAENMIVDILDWLYP